MRVRDLWFTTGRRGEKHKTARHPDSAGRDKDRRKELQNAKRWLAIWQDPSGRERTRAFRTQAAAEAHARKMEADAERGEYIDPADGAALVGPLAAKWLRLREVGAASATRYEQCYRLHIAPVFAARPAGAVKPSEVAEWSRALADHPVTRHLALTILTGIFDLAVADKVRRDNPARERVVVRPKQQRRRVKPDPWDARRILAVADACGAYRAVPVTAAGLGVRQGECFGLGLDDFDLGAGVVHVRRQLARHEGRWVFKLPKGGKTRDVPLPRGVAAMTDHPDVAMITLPWLAEDGTLGKPVTVPLVLHEDGSHLRFLPFARRVWKPALASAGVIPAYSHHDYPVAREHGMHALRHWYSTHLLDAGVSLAAVMEFMGHSAETAPLAIGVYGHVTPEASERARRAVDEALFGAGIVTSDGTVTELEGSR